MLHQYSFALFAIITIVSGENPHVTIPQGTLKGHTMKSEKGREFLAYQGIPYAKPPTGKLRFKPTQPAEPWKGTLDATKECPVCPQIDLFITKKFTGKEDCLFLNVYIPKIVTGNEISKLPVMVFIHGGGFMLGSSQTYFCSPLQFMDRDVVLVTINYRLGALGFLSTGDEVSPGNYGLYDQLEALNWVKKNIAYFGGDPQKVTIFGESAGGASVSHLVISPKAKGLFEAAILQSGSSLSNWSLVENPNKWTKFLAIKSGCSVHTSKRIIDCLNTKSAEEIVTISKDVKFMPNSMIFTPVVENTPDGFFPEHPLKLLKNKLNNKVPTISGVNKDEGGFNVAHLESIFDLYSPAFLETDFLETAPTAEFTENRLQATNEVVKHYIKNVDPSNKVEFRKALTKIYSDSTFHVGAEMLAQALSKNGLPTYTYMFTHRGKTSFTDIYGTKEDYGVVHADELQYMFGFFGLKLEGDDKKVSELFLDLWTNFARTHDPTPGNDLLFKWHPTESSSPRYLDINLNPKMVNEKLTENVDFWTKIFGHTTSIPSRKDEL